MWFDLSHPYYAEMPLPPRLTEGPRLTRRTLPALHKADGRVQITEIFTANHVGTHVDAPSHFFEDGRTLSDLDVDRFVGDGVIVDIEKQELEPITDGELMSAEPKIRSGDIVFIKTGWSKRFASDPIGYQRFPFLTPAAADWLLSMRVKMLGTDTISPDPPAEARPPGYRMDVHATLLKNDILIVENLNLGMIPACRCLIVACPLHLQDSDGAPARVLALPEDDSSLSSEVGRGNTQAK